MGKGGIVGDAANVSFSGVWKLGEVYREKYDGTWPSNIVLDNYTFTTTDTDIHTYPNNISSGDLILGVTSEDGSVPGTYPVGWIAVTTASGDPKMHVYYKLATGTETGTFSLVSDSNVLALFKKGSTVNFDTAGALVTPGAVSSISPSITTTKKGLLICCLISNTANFTITNTDGMTLAVNDSTIGQPEIKILTQPSEANTTYNKTITTSESNAKKAILINIY